MRRKELDYVLSTMLDSNNDVSDLNVTVDKPLQVETSGQLVPVEIQPNNENQPRFFLRNLPKDRWQFQIFKGGNFRVQLAQDDGVVAAL